jgi:hypothetical protein
MEEFAFVDHRLATAYYSYNHHAKDRPCQVRISWRVGVSGSQSGGLAAHSENPIFLFVVLAACRL